MKTKETKTLTLEELFNDSLDKKPDKGFKLVLWYITNWIDTTYWTFRRWWTDNFIMFFKRCFWKCKYGFDISETWNLDYSICKWLLPRIKYFREHTLGYPATKDLSGLDFTMESWEEYLDHIIYWCECIVTDEEPFYIEGDEKYGTEELRKKKERYDLGKRIFSEYFYNLWW